MFYNHGLIAETWNVTCTYSPFLASPTPKCCVSFSAFYHSDIVPCPLCSCNCQGQPKADCIEYNFFVFLIKLFCFPFYMKFFLLNCTVLEKFSVLIRLQCWNFHKQIVQKNQLWGVHITCVLYEFIGMWNKVIEIIGGSRSQSQI
jgi:hypothetical protein